MSQDESFDALIDRLRAGDEEAAAAVFRRFTGRLVALARSRLDTVMRAKVDPESVVQSALGSFFRREADRPFELDGWDGLWGLLARITLRKCGRRVEYFRAARRDVRREIGPPAADDSGPSWEALAREPTPPEAAVLAETVEGLLDGLEGRDREIVVLALQGHTAPEISGQLDRPLRTVYRVLGRVRKRLEAPPQSEEAP